MAETPSIPPTSPSTTSAVSGSGAVSELTPVMPANRLSRIPLRQTPAELTRPPSPVIIEGAVVSSDPKLKKLIIKTKNGNIDLQSKVSLPPGTKVSVKLYTQQNQTHANLTILPSQTPPTLTPSMAAPMLQQGQKLIALLLQDPLPIQASNMAASLKNIDLEKINLPLLQNTIEELIKSPDIKNTLEKLPPQDLREIFHFIVTHEKYPTNLSSPKAPQTDDTPDKNLIDIIRTQLTTKNQQHAHKILTPNQTGKFDSPHSQGPLVTNADTLNALFSLIENVETLKTVPLSTNSLLPSEEKLPLPKNMYEVSVLKILSPETSEKQLQEELEKTPLPKTGNNPATIQKKQIPGLPLQIIEPQIAQVESITPGGHPIIKSEDTHFVIKTPITIEPGSFIIITTTPMTPEQIIETGTKQYTDPHVATHTVSASLIPEDFVSNLGKPWSNLEEALQTLQQTHSSIVETLQKTIPTPTKQLPPTALFFLAALRLGQIDNWIGETVLKALKDSGKAKLAEQLRGDFIKLSALSRDIVGEDWRPISIPLLYDEHIHNLQFFVRQQQEEGDTENSDKKITRFILNLHLSRMGDIQLDGFINKKKKLNLILRTEDKLPFNMRQDLMQRFAQGLDQVHMQGGISFQIKKEHWITVGEEKHKGIEA